MIRKATPEDAKAIAGIYNHYVLNTVVTFDETPISEEEYRRRIIETTKEHPWLVYEENGVLIGYAYANRWKSRCSYRLSIETTVYLHPDHPGKGIGSELYAALIHEVKERPVHAIIGGISLPNEASVRLHEKMGFVKVAHFREVGFKFNEWVDVGYWELLPHNG